MNEGNDPKFTIDQLVKIFYHVPIPHKAALPWFTVCLLAFERLYSRFLNIFDCLHSIINLSEYVFLQTVRQIVRIREVKTCLLHLKVLEHIHIEDLIISICVIERFKQWHHFCFVNLVDAVFAYFANAFSLCYQH